MGKAGRPPRTTCRHCGEGGELVKGAHVECRNEYYRRAAAEKRPPAKCRRCNVGIEDPNKLCDQCRVICRRELRRRYERNRPAESKKRRDRKKPKPKKYAKPHPMNQIVVSPPKPETGPVVNPRGVEPRRIPPVGAAGWSVAEARRFG